VLHVAEALLIEVHGGAPSMSLFVWGMKAAATGDRARFDRVVAKIPDAEMRYYLIKLAETTVFEELQQRASPKRKFPWKCWNVEILMMLEPLLGEPETPGPDPRVLMDPLGLLALER